MKTEAGDIITVDTPMGDLLRPGMKVEISTLRGVVRGSYLVTSVQGRTLRILPNTRWNRIREWVRLRWLLLKRKLKI